MQALGGFGWRVFILRQFGETGFRATGCGLGIALGFKRTCHRNKLISRSGHFTAEQAQTRV